MHESLVHRALIITSVFVGLIAFDAYRYRRQLARFARFTGVWNAPVNSAADRTYREAMIRATDR